MDLSKPEPPLTLLRTELSSYPDTNTHMDVWDRVISDICKQWVTFEMDTDKYKQFRVVLKLTVLLKKLCGKPR